MKKIQTIDELKKIQLNILLCINEFCRDNGISYSLACGTLLGAIRHKGYIPWDDDIDIQLLREDYEKLVTSFPEEYKNIRLLSLERNDSWNRAYARAYDYRTIEIEGVRGEIEGLGVGIDVFPIDSAPDDNSRWIKYNKKRMFLQNIYQLKLMRLSSNRFLFKNLIIIIAQLLLLPFTLRALSQIINRYAQKYNTKGFQYLYENCQGIGKRRNKFLFEDFSEYIDVEFEGYKLKAIKGYDDYLKNSYGEYMKLPPVEKRVSTHTFEAYWK